MRYLLLLLIAIFPVITSAQPDFASLQMKWLHTATAGDEAEQLYWDRGSLRYVNGKVYAEHEADSFVRKNLASHASRYQQLQLFRHDADRYITAGKILRHESEWVILSGWRNTNEGWKKEIDVLLPRQAAKAAPGDSVTAALRTERRQWVELANSHDPRSHITYSYSDDAVYFGNGRTSSGTDGIAQRYSYMENPNYTVDLKMQYLHRVSDMQIIEVGRYFAGSAENNPGGLYLILWQKRGEQWKIGLDFNF